MTAITLVRNVQPSDRAPWRQLWDGYNAFYGRRGATALPEPISEATWQRLFTPSEPVHGLVAESGGQVVGLAHYLFHRSTTRLQDVCYLQDLFVADHVRGLGIGRKLIDAVIGAARAAGASRVYWQTHESNAPARALYESVGTHAGFNVYTHDS